MAIVDPETIADILVECAEIYILPRYKQLKDHEIASKTGPRDLVTQADIDVEAHLERVLPDLLPGSVVIGEEGISRGDMNLDVLKDTSQKVWVVDPVDGTHNFVSGKREFGVMLACVIDGVTQYGWIYDVLGQVSYISEKGSGAFMGAERLTIKPRAGLENMMAYINYRYFPKEIQPAIQKAASAFKDSYSLGCAAHEYTRIAKGEADVALYSRLKPWDHLPGSLIVQEAGGYIAKWDGGEYTPQDDYAGLIVTSSEENWKQAFSVIFQDIDIKSYL